MPRAAKRSGSASAALGGVTGFFEMPNTNPSTDSAERLAWKVARAKETSWVDFAFYVGATMENADALGTLEQGEGVVGIKMFCGSSTGSLLVDKPAGYTNGLFGPSGLAPEAVSQLSQKAKSALADEKVLARVRDNGCVPAYIAAADFATFLGKESARMRDLVKT